MHPPPSGTSGSFPRAKDFVCVCVCERERERERETVIYLHLALKLRMYDLTSTFPVFLYGEVMLY